MWSGLEHAIGDVGRGPSACREEGQDAETDTSPPLMWLEPGGALITFS